MHEAFLKASSEAKYSFRIRSRTGENMGYIFCITKLSKVSERGCEST